MSSDFRLGWLAARLGRESPATSPGRLGPFPPQQRPHGARCREGVGLLEDPPLVLGRVRSPPRLRGHLHLMTSR